MSQTTKNEAVRIEGNQVELVVHYCIANLESDSNRFSEVIGGRYDTTKDEAIAAVVGSAKAWATGLRADGHDVCVWDDAGNFY